MVRNFLTFIFWLQPLLAHSRTFGLEYTQTSSSKTNNAYLKGDLNYDEEPATSAAKDEFPWGLDFTQSKQQTTDSTSGQSLEETTYSSAVSLGWDTPRRWSWNVDYNYTNTPDENLTSKGPRLSLDYTFVFNKPKVKKPSSPAETRLEKEPQMSPNSEEDEEFAPELSFGVSYGTNDYSETYTASKKVVSGRLKNRTVTTVPISGAAVISQKDVTGSTSWTYWEPLTLSLSYTRYTYDKDPATFTANLSQFPATGRTINGLSQALSGFSTDSVTAAIDWSFMTHWRASLKRSVSHSATYDESTTGNSVGLEVRMLRKYKIKISGENDVVNGSSSNSSSNIYSVGFSYYNW